MIGNYYELFGMNNGIEIESLLLNSKVKRYQYSNSSCSYEILNNLSEEDKFNTIDLDPNTELIYPLCY